MHPTLAFKLVENGCCNLFKPLGAGCAAVFRETASVRTAQRPREDMLWRGCGVNGVPADSGCLSVYHPGPASFDLALRESAGMATSSVPRQVVGQLLSFRMFASLS